MTHGSLFSGVGGFDLAAEWMGWENLFHCEINEWCQKVLRFHFPKSIQYDDITRTDFAPWRGKVDVLTGGFPCQPFSTAGKRRGAEDDRYLWPEMLRAIREIRPAWVIGENVAGITSMVQPGSEVTVESQASLFETSDKETLLEQEYVIETVCRDLEREGYSVQPILIPACGVGAPHKRDRVWFIASDRSDARIEGLRQERENEIHGRESTSHSNGTRFQAKGSEQQTTGITGGGLQKDVTDTYGEKLQKWLKNNGREIEEENIARLDNGVERSCCIKAFADSDNERLSTIGITDRVSSEEREKKRRCLMQYTSNDWLALSAKRWKDFPTQPPVCRRYDGLPFDVDYLAIPFTKWRQESIKAYGNAIVPQVAFEIFKAIEASIHL
ncbi:DNA cytosine methyltransferase [Parabacteroides distasonis]|jgi:DNA (cytosine-5)-methyltransferase 1|uniref:DNA cytosine methyltransferase n=1 Tax=Parabacteroides distasonis TaxID=823 RepID=UPI00356159B2